MKEGRREIVIEKEQERKLRDERTKKEVSQNSKSTFQEEYL